MVSQQAIQKYKELYQRRYGVELSDVEAMAKAESLLKLYWVLFNREDKSRV